MEGLNEKEAEEGGRIMVGGDMNRRIAEEGVGPVEDVTDTRKRMPKIRSSIKRKKIGIGIS